MPNPEHWYFRRVLPTLRLTSEFAKAMQSLTALQREQVPFAAARALTMTAQDIQDAERATMAVKFTLRRQWVVQGIRIKPARKQDWPASYAVVYSRDAFMNIQERGGVKVAIGSRVFDYHGMLAIPLDARRSKTDVVLKKDWPANLINPFVLTARDGRKYLAVRDLAGNKGKQRRVGTGARGTWSGTRLMYTLIDRETLKPRLGLQELGRKVAPIRFPINFANALADAMATAR